MNHPNSAEAIASDHPTSRPQPSFNITSNFVSPDTVSGDAGSLAKATRNEKHEVASQQCGHTDQSHRTSSAVSDTLNHAGNSASSSAIRPPHTKENTRVEFMNPVRRNLSRTSQISNHSQPKEASHFATLQEKYLLKICRALMMYGAPTHRLEEYMHMTAQVLELPLQSFYMPGCMIVSFNDTLWRSTEVHIVRCTQALNLSKLYDVHAVYKDIIHSRIAIEEATARLDNIMGGKDKFNPWLRVLMYGAASAAIGPVSYGARPVDLPFIFLLGSLLGFMELIVAPKSELYAHIFEISSAIFTSFVGRAFGSIRSGQIFCFSAIAQASLVLILPGFMITTSALELQSKNIVAGSVRLVYSIIFSLFLAFGFNIGITIYGAIDGGATSATQCSNTWPFWWQVIFVPVFTLCYVIVNQAKWNKMPAMILITFAGWIVNHFSSNYFTANPQIPQVLAALTVGILANLCSRLGQGLAVALLHPAIFILVPGSFAANGSLISGVSSANQTNSHGNNGTDPTSTSNPNHAILNAGYSMVEIAIAITVGLSVAVLLVYPLRKTKGKSGIFSF